MTIGLLKEPAHETRVSLLAEAVATLTKKGITVLTETGAGERAFCSDADYVKAGASVKSRAEVLQSAELLLTIHQPAAGEISGLSGKVLIGVFQPLFNVDQMKTWAAGGLTSFSLDMLPRTTRASPVGPAAWAGSGAQVVGRFGQFFGTGMIAGHIGQMPPARNSCVT